MTNNLMEIELSKYGSMDLWNYRTMEPWKIEVNGEKNGDLSSLDKQPNGTF